jgi:hypothetical protein
LKQRRNRLLAPLFVSRKHGFEAFRGEIVWLADAGFQV